MTILPGLMPAPAQVQGSVKFITSAVAASDSSHYVFSGVAIGDPAPDRDIIVAVAMDFDAGNIASCFVGGVNAQMAAGTQCDDAVGTAIFIARVPLGTTATIDVYTEYATGDACGIGVYRATGLASKCCYDTDYDFSNAAGPNTCTITVPPNGFAIGVSMATGSTAKRNVTFSPGTETYDQTVRNYFGHYGFLHKTPGVGTVFSETFSGALAAQSCWIVASWRFRETKTRVEFCQEYSVPTNAKTYTFDNMNLGAPAPDRHIVIGVAFGAGMNEFVESATIGGVTATVRTMLNPWWHPTNNFQGLSFISALVPLGATGTVQVTTNAASSGRCGISIWRVTGCGSELRLYEMDAQWGGDDPNCYGYFRAPNDDCFALGIGAVRGTTFRTLRWFGYGQNQITEMEAGYCPHIAGSLTKEGERGVILLVSSAPETNVASMLTTVWGPGPEPTAPCTDIYENMISCHSPSRKLYPSWDIFSWGNGDATNKMGFLVDQRWNDWESGYTSAGTNPVWNYYGAKSRRGIKTTGTSAADINGNIIDNYFYDNNGLVIVSAVLESAVGTNSGEPWLSECLLCTTGTTDNQFGIFFRNNGSDSNHPNAYAWMFDGAAKVTAAKGIVLGEPFVAHWRWQGGKVYLGLNDVETAGVNCGRFADGLDKLRLGNCGAGNHDFNGTIFEEVAFNGALITTAQRAALITDMLNWVS